MKECRKRPVAALARNDFFFVDDWNLHLVIASINVRQRQQTAMRAGWSMTGRLGKRCRGMYLEMKPLVGVVGALAPWPTRLRSLLEATCFEIGRLLRQHRFLASEYDDRESGENDRRCTAGRGS